jgi:CubicO group peptidase (beta-lactamase class C family)
MMNQVENSLSGWVQIEGMPLWSLADRMRHYNVKGVSIALIKDNKVHWAKGYGWADEERKIRLTTNTLLQAGSISKSINSLGLLKLVQENKLGLYEDINQFLISWKFPYDSLSHQKTISLANLLSHTAGLNVHGFPGYTMRDSMPTVINILNGHKPSNTVAVRSIFQPDSTYQYSGGGTLISQQLLMDVSGLPYDKYMTQYVLQPLGMRKSTFTQPNVGRSLINYATAYDDDGNKIPGRFHRYPEQAAAGLWTTPLELCNYIIETQRSFAGTSQKVLIPEMTKVMLTPYKNPSAALGVFVSEFEGVKYFSHNGQDEGFTSTYYGSLDGNGFVVMCNSNNGALNSEIFNSITRVYKWRGLEPVVKRKVKVAESILNRFVGSYSLYDNRFIIHKEEGELFLNINKAPTSMKMNFTSDSTFFLMELTGEFTALNGKGGMIEALLHKQGNDENKNTQDH